MKAWMPLLLLGLSLAGCQMMEPRPATSPERIEVIDRSEPAPREAEPAPPDAEPEATPPGRVAREVAFPEAEYARLEKHGSASISGRLTLDGQPIPNASISVAPVTTYSAEAAEKALAGIAVEPADARAREYTHTTRTDGNGRFRLNGLPAGEFYVSGSLRDPRSGKPRVIIHQVSLHNGQQQNVVLSR